MKKQELIFVPVPGAGHLISTLEFAKLLLDQDDRITVTVLIIKMQTVPVLDSYTNSLVASQPRIRLINLPEVVPPPIELLAKSIESYICAFLENCIPPVKAAVNEIVSSRSNSDSIQVAALVLDLFCVAMIDVGNEFGIPSYIYFTSNAGFLNHMFYLLGRHEEIGREFVNSDSDVLMPGFVNPVPPAVLPEAVFNIHGGYTAYVMLAQRFRDAKGIIINTFAELESYAISILKDVGAPPVYPVGPVLNLKGQPHPEFENAQWDKIVRWLDEQPQSSVLFLCFGSMGSFSAQQVQELAIGLERSGDRFLWALRSPSKASNGDEIKNPEEMLPAGFLERIGGRGVICGWAPQVEVLEHKAIGAFFSHCGWNSILESLWYGVPIVTLPIYAEQQLNAFLMVRELGLAVELRLDYRRDHLVMADEIERAVRCVMESDGEVRKKVKEMREFARKAVIEGGSSHTSIAKLIEDMTCSS